MGIFLTTTIWCMRSLHKCICLCVCLSKWYSNHVTMYVSTCGWVRNFLVVLHSKENNAWSVRRVFWFQTFHHFTISRFIQLTLNRGFVHVQCLISGGPMWLFRIRQPFSRLSQTKYISGGVQHWFQCATCARVFSSKDITHTQTHIGGVYMCSICKHIGAQIVLMFHLYWFIIYGTSFTLRVILIAKWEAVLAVKRCGRDGKMRLRAQSERYDVKWKTHRSVILAFSSFFECHKVHLVFQCTVGGGITISTNI